MRKGWEAQEEQVRATFVKEFILLIGSPSSFLLLVVRPGAGLAGISGSFTWVMGLSYGLNTESRPRNKAGGCDLWMLIWVVAFPYEMCLQVHSDNLSARHGGSRWSCWLHQEPGIRCERHPPRPEILSFPRKAVWVLCLA